MIDFWKSLTILKEIKKHSCKFFRVWEKPIKIWNFWEIFEIYIQKSQWKIIFTLFLSHLPRLLSFYTHLQHTKIWGVGSFCSGVVGVLSSLGGSGRLYKSLNMLTCFALVQFLHSVAILSRISPHIYKCLVCIRNNTVEYTNNGAIR